MHRILEPGSGRVGNPPQAGASRRTGLRLQLTQATGQILQNGLHVLGIETPEKM